MDVSRLRRESQELQENLFKDKKTVDSLEKLLAETRRELTQQQLLNEELQSEIKKLKSKLVEMQGNL